jgi:poly(A) polymerase/tRNA nucleotidyltransferase (CCA-adding enzyme)
VIELPGVAAVWAALPEARIVGGAVRDMLAGRAVADVDFASPLEPGEVMVRLRGAAVKVVPTGLAHGTVTAVVGGRGFEITTLRRDVQTDGRHAVVAFTDDWQADAARRDFTINAMSMSRAGVIYDYFGGRADLAAGVVRFVGEARLRIAEDYLRILRFFRFFARYATAPDAAAVAAIAELRDGVLGLSAERVWGELKRILQAPDPRAALALMRETGVLALVVPEGADVAAVGRLVRRGAPVDPLLRVAALLLGDVEAFAALLKLSNEEAQRLRVVRVPNRLRPGADVADLRRALADTPADVLVARTWLGQDDAVGWDDLRGRLEATARPVFPLQGRDVTALGVSPGPLVGEILAAVRGWWLEGGCLADRAACRERAIKLAGTTDLQ